MPRLDSTIRGFLIPDPRLGVDGLAPNDGSATGSDYTQVGPRPGSSTQPSNSRIVTVLSNGLSDDVEVQFQRAGDPGIDARRSARARWKFASDADANWRGYSDAMDAHYWMPVVWNNSGFGAETGFDVIADRVSQRVLVVHRQDGATDSTQALRSVGINHFESAGAVVTSQVSPVVIPAAGDDVCATQLPLGTVLVLDNGRMYASEDCFTASSPTWELYSETPTPSLLTLAPVGFTPDRARMQADRDGNVLLLLEQNGAGATEGYVVQLVSSNLGATFFEVSAADLGGNLGPYTAIVALPDGSMLVGYLTTGGQAKVRRIGTVFDSIAVADEIEVSTTAYLWFDIWSDQRGAVFALAGGPASRDLYRSEDGGLSWTLDRWGPWSNTGIPAEFGPERSATVSARGMTWMVHGSPGTSGYEGDSLGCLRLGGWTNAEPGSDPGVTTATSGRNFQRGWWDSDGTIDTRTWIPFSVPDAGGSDWVQEGATAGTIVGGSTGKAMEIATVATDGRYRRPLPGGDGVTIYAATSARGNGGSLSSLQHGIEIITENSGGPGVATHVEVRILTTSSEIRFLVHDVQAATDLFELPLSADFVEQQTAGTEPYLEFAISVEEAGLPSPDITLLYRRTSESTWVTALEDVTLATGAVPAAGASVAMGATVAGTTEQLWRAFYVREAGTLGQAAFRLGTSAGRPQVGAEISTLPIPLALAGQVDVDEALLALRGGPARYAELHTVPVIHDFALSNALFDAEPSRAVRWRDTGSLSVDRLLTWRFPEPTRLGGSFLLGLVALDANFDQAELRIDTAGGGVYTTAATLDLREGFTSLAYERTGDMIRPGVLDAGTGTGDRFINRAELVRGVARWGSASAGTEGVARIEAISAGGWTDKGTDAVQPFVRVESDKVAGTSAASDGVGPPIDTLSLQAPSGLVVAYLDEVYVYGIQVRIPATKTPEGYREAGLIMPCVFAAVGKQWSRGYSLDTRPNAIRDESSQGTIRKREEGPPATRISVAWPDGVKLRDMRKGIAPNYLGPVGKPPVVADSDVWGQLVGVLDETESGRIPVVYVATLPPDGVTVTDRTLFGFGTLDGSARFDHVVGDEDENEFGRIGGVQVSEIR